MKPRKTLEKILSGSKNIRFDDLPALVRAFGFNSVKIRELTTSVQGVSPAPVKRGEFHVLACPLAALLSANWGKGAGCCAGPVLHVLLTGCLRPFWTVP